MHGDNDIDEYDDANDNLIPLHFHCTGSEKWNIRQTMKDEHIAEMTNINLRFLRNSDIFVIMMITHIYYVCVMMMMLVLSLHTLGRCISALAQKSNGKEVHIPYRSV